MESFNIKTQIYFGDGSLERLSQLDCKRAFIVTDPFMVKSGAINKITDEVSKGDIQYMVFSDIVPDPPIEVVVKGIEVMMKFNPEVVIALGGGSAIDAAKAICSFSSKIHDRMDCGVKNNKKIKFIAIPTTSGTGSEVTSFSVITDKSKNIKYPLVSDELLPDEAILDAELVTTVPNFITGDTGMDVLTHAIEAYVSTKATDYTDALAEKSIKLVFENLMRAYKNGNDLDARKKMHNASCIAGIAFNNASLGLNHGMAHIVGGRFHVSHGKTNAILLPYVIEYNADLKGFNSNDYTKAAKRYSEISKILGLPSSNVRQGVKSLIAAINKLLNELNMPTSLKETGIKADDFKKEVSQMALIAIEDRCTETNPRVPNIEEIIALFERVFDKK
ncbi:iron-containing alcohol dehydrogenase [Clostridium sp. CF011]|uniref:1-propanol dehydrogenase PduQ n=1 Tax=unclassified Clostridium TaxID=2614128 RepID=UPI001C0D91A4|nr:MULTISPECIES: 1-propanol dehydrogenase PduQ [unclassified Clostridium]MBU3092654.1 iron-containing alcohol dehydrogenase [Clostridium sp. CF011]MBW9145304.1 iron-containing alcohol dehydrogenase [Clostridium sp. CM027]UVE42444.1 iron-containing alcohol dehydrogenase [Clostridium sp. CM027]WAG71463.1 iron-containing alcohol dehydrogenase [Clostridium sp. CF011]